MRAALDEVGERLGRYVMLTNYASGLCMPEIAVDGGARAARHAAQRLDVRHPLPRHQHEAHVRRPALQPHAQRPLRDHHQHRRGQLPHDRRRRRASAGRLASQFINEEFAHRAGLPDEQIGLGDAYEINPDLEDSFLYQVAQAQLARQIFPDAPLKYMPPTKHMTGDIFKGHLIDAMFNLDLGDDAARRSICAGC